MIEPRQDNTSMMEGISVEMSAMPYRMTVGRTIVECDRPEEALALAELIGRERQQSV